MICIIVRLLVMTLWLGIRVLFKRRIGSLARLGFMRLFDSQVGDGLLDLMYYIFALGLV